MRKELRKFILNIIKDIFYISLISFIIYATLELFWPRFVTAYFNMNIILMIVLISGIITIINDD